MDMEVTRATPCITSCVLYFDYFLKKFSHPISFEVTAAILGSANKELRSEEGSGLSVAHLCKYYTLILLAVFSKITHDIS